MRGVYLSRQHSMVGRDSLGGRSLLAHMQAEHDVLLRYHVRGDGPPTQDLMQPGDLLHGEFGFLYVEGGLCDGHYARDAWRVPEPVLRQYLGNGGIVVIADVGLNDAQNHWALYRDAEQLLGARPDYYRSPEPPDPARGQRAVHYGRDEMRNFDRSGQNVICLVEQMYCNDWVAPMYDGIETLAVRQPCVLESGSASILASGNKDTSWTLYDDVEVQRPLPFPWATVHEVGLGFVVLLAGLVSDDTVVDQFPDNARWTTNMLTFLTDEVARSRERRHGTSLPPLPDPDRKMSESEALEFWAGSNRRRNRIELRLRDLIALEFDGESARRGEPGWPLQRLASVVKESGRARRLSEMPDTRGICDALLFGETVDIIKRDWPLLGRPFGDRRELDRHAGVINARADAHAKPSTVRDRIELDAALAWMEQRLSIRPDGV